MEWTWETEHDKQTLKNRGGKELLVTSFTAPEAQEDHLMIVIDNRNLIVTLQKKMSATGKNIGIHARTLVIYLLHHFLQHGYK